MHSIDLNSETHIVTRPESSFSTGSGDKVDGVASDMQEAVGTEIFDQLDFSHDPGVSGVRYAKILGANAKRQRPVGKSREGLSQRA